MAHWETLEDFFTADGLYALFYVCLISSFFLFFLAVLTTGEHSEFPTFLLEISILLLIISAIIGIIASRVRYKEELRKRS